MTDVLAIDIRDIDRRGVVRAAAILRNGGLVAFPTETVYGLGAHALNRAAVQRIFDVKGRPSTDPLIVHVHDVTALAPLAAPIPRDVDALAACFWPGPLTLVLKKTPIVPPEVTAGLATIAIRIPAHPIARALLEAAAIPIAAPSANLFSRPSPTRAEHVLQDLDGRIEMVVDGGPTPVGIESTVLDLTATPPAILRPGAVTLEMIRSILPTARLQRGDATDASGAMQSPGLLRRHYSPKAPLTLYEGPAAAVLARIASDAEAAVAAGQRVGVIAANDDPIIVRRSGNVLIDRLGPEDDAGTVAANLYDALRRLDASAVDVIFARAFSVDSGLGIAIQDRLRRAAAGRVVRVED